VYKKRKLRLVGSAKVQVPMLLNGWLHGILFSGGNKEVHTPEIFGVVAGAARRSEYTAITERWGGCLLLLWEQAALLRSKYRIHDMQ